MNVKIVKLNLSVFGQTSEIAKISSRENIDSIQFIIFSKYKQYPEDGHYMLSEFDITDNMK